MWGVPSDAPTGVECMTTASDLLPPPATLNPLPTRDGGESEADLLRRQLLQAQRLSSVGELASSVAHEFNNVIATVINFAKIGMRGQTPAAQAQAFEKI